MEAKYFDALMESLEDAAAFAKGDRSRARVVELEESAPPRSRREHPVPPQLRTQQPAK